MPLQDLTPQLRTRLSRMERAVGWFVFLATALLLFGFGYYIYQRAESKGWFKIKAKFHAYLLTAGGLKVGDHVFMMGMDVGQITRVHVLEPDNVHHVQIDFEIKDPYFRYIRSEGSLIKVNSGLLNQAQLEVTRGATNSYAICVTQPISVHSLDEAKNLAASAPGDWQLAQDVFDAHTNLLFHAYAPLENIFVASNSPVLATASLESNSIYIFDNKVNRNFIVASWHGRTHRYENFTAEKDTAWLGTIESATISDQLQAMVAQVQGALPGILALTNKLSAVLENAANATSNLNITVSAARPMLTNFTLISGQLREPGGVLTWALGTNGNDQLQGALTNVNSLLVSANTNLNELADSIGVTLDHVADITSNLNVQVQNNPNLMFGLVKTIGDADDFVQGLKHHWLLRSAFKTKTTNAPAAKSPAKSPRK